MDTPKKGFTQITVSDELKALVQKIAKKRGLSMPKLIEAMLRACYGEILEEAEG